MLPEHFSENAPGHLVQTTANEEYWDSSGNRRVRRAPGVAFVPDPLPPKIDLGQLLADTGTHLSEANRKLGLLDGLADDLQYAQLLVAPLLLREAIMSSRIEDTIATPLEVAAYDAGRPKARRETIEVANYRAAVLHGLHSKLPICMRLVCEMHDKLLRNARGETEKPGAIRELQNRIGGTPDDFSSARFVPPPAGEILQSCLKNLEDFWNTKTSPLPPLIAAAVAHYQFEAIHPFNDGNGRIGRALVVAWLCRANLLKEPLIYVSGYFEKHREMYYDRLLRVSTHGDWKGWCQFFLEAIADQAQDAVLRLRAIRHLRASIQQKITGSRSPAALMELVDKIIESPTLLSVTDVQKRLNASDPTARKYLRKLEEFEFLTEITGSDYGQVWAPSALFAIIDE